MKESSAERTICGKLAESFCFCEVVAGSALAGGFSICHIVV